MPGLEAIRRKVLVSAKRHKIQPEESWLLRLMVQILVSVGICATDLAAGTTNSLWAVPISFIGASWSWTHRHQRNLIAKCGIAIGMLWFLTIFLGNILGQANDTRILLAELLIQLQVLHTFDLPRRKDLGYSAIIGLILISVAATISETMAFGLFLLLFLAIALPVLILDYRSRLKLQSPKINVRSHATRTSLKRMSLLLTAVAVLGMTVFAFMPRLPGYQLRTFPVSAPIDVAGQFNNQEIINPGYVKSGTRTSQQSGSSQSEGTRFSEDAVPEVFDSTFYYGFNQEINQTLRGNLTPKTLMRVRTQAPGFWRVMAFDTYTGQGWKISENDKTQTLKRPRWSYRFLMPQLSSKSKTKEVVQTFSILTDFPNLIPALSAPRHVYFPTQEIAQDTESGLRSPVSLEEGLTYTVVSDVPYRDRTALKTAGTEYSDRIKQKYLQLPEAIAPKIKANTESLLTKSEYQPQEPSEQALLLAQLLKQHYSLQPDLPPLSADADMVESFLNDYQGGYADHFSTALTVMLRSIGIPARLVTGFAPGQFNPFTGMYVVKNTDAFAMTEVYFPKYGWFTFDPIPGHPIVTPSVEDSDRFPLLTQAWHWIAGWFPSPLKNTFSQLWLWAGTVLGSIVGLFSQGWIGIGILLLIGVAIGFIGWLIWQGWRMWRHRVWRSQLAPMERLYQDLMEWLKERGFSQPKSMTPLECLDVVKHDRSDLYSTQFQEIILAYVNWRYGYHEQNHDYLTQQFKMLKRQRLNSRAVINQHNAIKPNPDRNGNEWTTR